MTNDGRYDSAGLSSPTASTGATAAQPARGRTRIGEANIERILDAATEVFSAYGFHGARIGDIAESAGMSKPNLLYYFPSKEALYTAALSQTLEMWVVPLGEIDDAQEPADALKGYIVRKLEASRARPAASRLFAMEVIQGAPNLMPLLTGPLRDMVDAKVATMTRWIEAGRLAPIDPLHFIFSIWATTQHYADFSVQIRALAGSDLSNEAFFNRTRDALLDVLLKGVLPRT